MRDEFSEFYVPTKSQFDELWADGLIVLDTNVLLDLYRTPTDARGQFLSILENFKDRLWIPFQVGLEFHRNRPKVISDKGKNISAILSTAEKSFGDIENEITNLDIDKYGLGIESAPLLAELEQVRTKLAEAIGKVHASQVEMETQDPIQDTLFKLYAGKIGLGPKDQAELAALVADGESRYGEKIPPGYEDQAKSKNPNDATFYHNGIKYERRFGDLIFWKQIIAYTKSSNQTKIILVSSEKKEDWWRIEDGKKLGPQPDLIQELRRHTDVELFWMYPPDQFMRYAGQKINIDVSESALAEVRNAAGSNTRNTDDIWSDYSSNNHDTDLIDLEDAATENSADLFAHNARNAVFIWLAQYAKITRTEFYPDFALLERGKKHAFEVIPVHSLRRDTVRQQVRNTLEAMSIFAADEDFSSTYLFIVCELETYRQRFSDMAPQVRRIVLRSMIKDSSSHIDVGGVYFGVMSQDEFVVSTFSSGRGGHPLKHILLAEFKVPAIK